MADEATIHGIRMLLLEFYREGEHMLRGSADSAVAASSFMGKFPPFSNYDHLDRFLPKANGVEGGFDRFFIYLKPPRRLSPQSVVLLHANWHLGERDVFRLRLGMFVPKRNDEDSFGFVGYRFETPEERGNDDETLERRSIHDYWHAQPFVSFRVGDDDEPLPEAVCWLPTRLPAFPLDAKDIVQLIACAFISLHGTPGKEGLFRALRSGPARERAAAVATA